MNKKFNILWTVIPWILSVIVCVMLLRQCSIVSDLKEQMTHNQKALTDTVSYFYGKLGEEIATKSILIGNMETLKYINDSLYKRVISLEAKPEHVVYIKEEIINEKHDTAWIVSSPILKEQFDFSNKWRTLSGDITLKDSILGMHIEKDIVNADLVIGIKDGRAYVSSMNPYLHVNDIQGITLPKQRQKHWGFGPVLGVGLTHEMKIKPVLGVGVTYSLINW